MNKLYDFCCTYCDNKFEVFCEFSDLPNIKCPKCGSQAKQIPSFSGYQIKGNNSASVTPRSAGSFRRKK